MRRRLALISAFALVPLVSALGACDKKGEDMSPAQPDDAPRSKRPPPASSGIGSDPDNPSGAPGSSRVGTSPNRY